MERTAAFFAWLGAPFRAIRRCFPFSQAGLATLVYVVFAGAAPALTLATLWAMRVLQVAGQWTEFAKLADRNSWTLMIATCALGMFVSVRAVKLGPFEMSGFRNGQDPTAPPSSDEQPSDK